MWESRPVHASRISRSQSAEDRASVRTAIADAASRTGASFAYLFNQAKSESGLNPNAKAGNSSATGLYQFIDQSWLGVLKQHGAEHGYGWAADAIQSRPGGGWRVSDPTPRRRSTRSAAIHRLRADGRRICAGQCRRPRQALGRATNSTDLYFGHFLGLHGAKKFLTAAAANPDAPAASLFPREAAANRGIFYTKAGSPAQFRPGLCADGRQDRRPGRTRRRHRADPDGQPRRLDRPTSTALSNTPPSDVRLVDLPASTAAQAPSDVMLAMAEHRAGTSVLRPSPKNAMLAYMMVSAPFDV